MTYKILLQVGIYVGMLGTSSCGYLLQTSRCPLTEKTGIRKIFVSPFSNTTVRRGVEHKILDQVIRVLSSRGRVKIVQSLQDADAVLSGSILEASYAMNAVVSASELQPHSVALPAGMASFPVAASYVGNLRVSFELKQRAEKSPSPYVWQSTFFRSKPFPSSNQIDVPGVTSMLINHSEFDRLLSDLIESMAVDLNEAMLAMF